jgi:hypothetical protein
MSKTPEEVDAIVEEFKVDFDQLSAVEKQFVAELFFPETVKVNAALSAEAAFYAKQKEEKIKKQQAAEAADVVNDPMDLL